MRKFEAMMKKIIFFLSYLVLVNASAQDKKIDKLEILYAQGYYSKVLNKAEKLLADPLYDWSGLPSFYKSIAMFRLMQDERWFSKNPNCIDEAIEAYNDFLEHPSSRDYVFAHYFEIAALKTYLIDLAAKLKEKRLLGSAEKIELFIANQLNNIKGKIDVKPEEVKPSTENNNALSMRDQIVSYAKQFIGVKYVWAGSDENGFDCSGYTSYVMKKYGILLSRTASGQLNDSKKIKTDEAQKADLVFFGSDGKITHVGLVTSEKGAELEMIHASTSKGVIITNIIQSTYWNPKLQATGTYL